MKTDRKRELFIFSLIDNNSIKEHFERKAKDGWLLEGIKYNIAKYRRIEPAELVFSVDIYPEISPFKKQAKKDVEYYISFCEDAGWNYITSLNNLHIFYSKKEENLIPVQTDEEYKEKIMSKSITMELISLILIFLTQLVLLKTMLPFKYTDLYNNLSLVNFFFIPLVALLLFLHIASYVVWILRAKDSIRKGLPLPRENYNLARAKGIFAYGLSALLIIILLLAVVLDSINGQRSVAFSFLPWLISIIIVRVYNKKMLEKEKGLTQRIITSFFLLFVAIAVIIPITLKTIEKTEDNNLPKGYIGLTLSDFGMTKPAQYKSFTKSGSIFVKRRSKYWERYYENSIYTLYIQGRNPKVANYIFNELIKEEYEKRYYREIVPANDEYMDFDEAYYIDSNSEDNKRERVLLLRDNEIFFIESNYDLSDEENVKIVLERIRS